MDEFGHLLLTKVGLLLAILPWLVLAAISPVSGIPAAILLLLSFAGSAMWGYGYGWLSEDAD